MGNFAWPCRKGPWRGRGLGRQPDDQDTRRALGDAPALPTGPAPPSPAAACAPMAAHPERPLPGTGGASGPCWPRCSSAEEETTSPARRLPQVACATHKKVAVVAAGVCVGGGVLSSRAHLFREKTPVPKQERHKKGTRPSWGPGTAYSGRAMATVGTDRDPRALAPSTLLGRTPRPPCS